MRYRFHFDEHRCAACGACVIACLDEHDADLAAGDPARRAVRVIECAPRFRYRSESRLSARLPAQKRAGAHGLG